jgi:uncharacterized protein YndB with AHSA1/START domain
VREGNSLLELSSVYIEEGIKDAREARESYREPLGFYAELYIEHSPSDVWSYFSNLANWRRWSPICRGCRLNCDRGELRLGSILEISFAVMGITMMVPSRVVQFDPPNLITWQGQKFGVNATHSYRFIPRNEGTLLCNEETFRGVSLPLKGLMSAWYRATKLSEVSLQGIRRELEDDSVFP